MGWGCEGMCMGEIEFCFEYVEFKITVVQKVRKSRKESEQSLVQRYTLERHQVIESMRVKMTHS